MLNRNSTFNSSVFFQVTALHAAGDGSAWTIHSATHLFLFSGTQQYKLNYFSKVAIALGLSKLDLMFPSYLFNFLYVSEFHCGLF